MEKDIFDGDIEGQISLDDYYKNDIPEGIFAVSKVFARARKQMNLPEFKAFTYILTKIRYTEENDNVIILDKKKLAEAVGINSDTDHLSVDLRRSIGKLPLHSFVEFQDDDRDFYESGVIVTRIRMYKNKVYVKMNEEYMKLFSNLEKDYITMWSADIFGMSSQRSVTFYESLRLNSDTRKENCKGYGIKALKEMLDIPKDGKGSYMRKDGHFNRKGFEDRVIDPLCEDLAKCKMIKLIVQENGKYYEKIKAGNRVLGYKFYWTVSDRPGIAAADEVDEVYKTIMKNPEILKIAKDIVAGSKNGKKKGNKNGEQREYNYEELEKMLLSGGTTEGNE